MAEEKKAATLACAFACVEGLLPVEFWRQRFLEQLHVESVHAEELGKLIESVVGDLNLRIYDLRLATVSESFDAPNIRDHVAARGRTPLISVLDFYLTKNHSDVPVLDDVLHLLESLELVLTESIFHEIKQGKLAYSL